MKFLIYASFFLFSYFSIAQTTFNISSESDLNSAISSSSNGDILELEKDIVVTAEKIFSGKTLTINGNGYLITVPRPGLDDMGRFNTNPSNFRVFRLQSSANLTINDLKIKGGGINISQGGGAIYVSSGTVLRINRSVISNSLSGTVNKYGGGGIAVAGTVFMKNSFVRRNAAQYGGGILVTGTGRAFIESSTMVENRSTSTSGGGGAAECQSGSIIYFNNSTLSNNQSTEIGGAINNYRGTVYFINSSATGNVAFGSFSGGAIGNNGGNLYILNSLFAHNYRRSSGTVSDPSSYVLDDFQPYSGPSGVRVYYSIYHASLPTGLGANSQNIQYSGLANGSNNTVFSGGILAKITDNSGKEIGGDIFRPFLFSNSGSVAPTLKLGSFVSESSSKGVPVRFDNNNNSSPAIAYYNGSNWINILGSSNTDELVTHDQVGTIRDSTSPSRGAIEGELAATLYILKVNGTDGGTVNGGTIYGDVYPAGTDVKLTAIPENGKKFVKWQKISENGVAVSAIDTTKGSGDLSQLISKEAALLSNQNPYTHSVSSNLTIEPVFETQASGSYTITYIGNGNSDGAPPSSGTFNTDQIISGPGTLVRDGFGFTGWNTNSNGSGDSYSSGDTYTLGVNLSLYAQWEEIKPVGSIVISEDPSSPSADWSLANGVLIPLIDGANVNIDEVSNALISGDLQIQAVNDITFDATLNSVLTNSRSFTLKAGRNIKFAENAAFSVSNSLVNVVLWSDSDGDETGGVLFDRTTSIVTNGGNLWVGGGDANSTWNGLTVGDSHTGNLTLSATGVSETYAGVNAVGAILNAGSGNIFLYGKSKQINYRYGVGTRINGMDITGNSIEIRGLGSRNSNTSGDTNRGNWGVGIENSEILATGNVLIFGEGGGQDAGTNGGSNYGILINSTSKIITSGSSNISINGTGGGNASISGNDNNDGIQLDGSTIRVNAGTITLNGTKGLHSSSEGIQFVSSRLESKSSDTQFSNGSIVIESDDLSMDTGARFYSLEGSITIKPKTNSTSISIGNSNSGLNLPSTLFSSNIVDGFSEIVVGSSSQSGNIEVSPVILNDNISLYTSGIVSLTSNFDLNNQIFTIYDPATLDLSGFDFDGLGTLRYYVLLNGPAGRNVGGLGAKLSSGANMGRTLVARSRSSKDLGSGRMSIKRNYTISPSNNTGLNADLVFSYDDSLDELNGIDEENLGLFKSIDGGETFTKIGGVLDALSNTITISNQDGFSVWTAGDVKIPATVSTEPVSAILSSSASFSGEVTSEGSEPVSERGFVYSTNTSPTISDIKLITGSGLGTFNITAVDLIPSTTYYMRAYATSGVSTVYGSEETFSTSNAFQSGSGTSSDPYQISNWAELSAIRHYPGSNFILTTDLSSSTPDYVGIGDSWTPIIPFTGTLDGSSNTISDLVINLSSSNVGLFGRTNGASISDLGLIDAVVTVPGSMIVGSNVGTLVGIMEGGSSISNSFSSGGSVNAEGSGVGGLVGQIFDTSSIIENSYATTSVSGGSDSNEYSGGLVGVSSGTIQYSYSAGPVALRQISVLGSILTFSTGLVQNNGGTVLNSYYDQDVTGQSTGSGIPLTTVQMKQRVSFSNWDFQCETTDGVGDFWGINEGNAYPVLTGFGYVMNCPDSTAPIISVGQSFSYAENQSAVNGLGTVLATDDNGVVGFSLLSVTGSDNNDYTADSLFSIDNSGEISITASGLASLIANDFETAPLSFVLSVVASDAAGNISSPTDIVLVKTDINEEPPLITGPGGSSSGDSTSISIPEGTLFVYQFTADKSVTWGVSGTDASAFIIASDGKLDFNFVTDFDSPADDNVDNVYQISILASDSFGNISSISLSVIIDDVFEDSDGDGTPDHEDAFPYDPTEDTDTDGDRVGDDTDNCPNTANADQADLDGDGIGDVCDPDIDRDGIPNDEDAFPYDPSEDTDTDGDGVGDNADAFPNDPNEDTDTDGDGVGDNADPSPFEANAYDDTAAVSLNEPLQVMVLDNDDFVAGADITLTHTGGTAKGTVSMDATSGALTYMPLPEEAGTTVTVTYQVCHKTVCATATVTLEIEPDADGDGIGDSADPDDDNDGVEDIYDQCPGTPPGTAVDINGCALTTVGSSAFSVAATSVSCTNIDDGVLTLTAADTRYSYAVTVSGQTAFDLDDASGYTRTLTGLPAGSYQVCFTPEELPEQQQCYTVTIDRPTALEVNTQLIEDSKQLKLTLQGAASYTVEVNGLATTHTGSSTELKLKTGLNRIRIYTDQECQGVIEKEVFVSEVLEYAPNPVINNMELYIGGTDQEVTLTLSNISGGVLYRQTVSVPLSRIYTVDLSRYSQGTYILQAQGPTVSKTIKVIKR